MLDKQVIPQIDRILRFRSKDWMQDGKPKTQKRYEEFEVYNDHFGHMYYNPIKDLQEGQYKRSRVGLIPFPPKEMMMQKFGVKQSFLDEYEKLKLEYFESLDSNEEAEEKLTQRDLARIDRQLDSFQKLATNLKEQKKMTKKEISALSGVPRSTMNDWF